MARKYGKKASAKVKRAMHERKGQAIVREVKAMLQNARDWHVIWDVEDCLRARRREIDQKYDYRYSVLMMLFSRLYIEGWLNGRRSDGARRGEGSTHQTVA